MATEKEGIDEVIRRNKSYKDTVKKAVAKFVKDKLAGIPSPEAQSFLVREGYTMDPKSQKDYVNQIMRQMGSEDMDRLIKKFPNLTIKEAYNLLDKDFRAGNISITPPKKKSGGKAKKKYNYRRGGMTTLRKPKRGK
jgi:hypothetical protein